MRDDNAPQGKMKPTASSRVTNGTAILPGVDGRSTWVRRMRDVMNLHISDLGGDDFVSEAQRSLARRAATMTVELERMELAFATGDGAKAADLDLYQRTTGNLRRVLESLGLERKQKDITDLGAYLKHKQREAAA